MNELGIESHWPDVMKKHAKSFHLASLFFPKTFFRKVKAIYALCRWIDDAADEAPTVEQSKKNLEIILQDLKNDRSQLEPNQIYKANKLDTGYIEDLIEGASDDLKTVRIKDRNQLIQYCYKVAGTVGLVMNDLMDVKDQQARAFAVDLGIAMQITNICRDIREDAERNRVYIPETLLKKHNIEFSSLLQLRVDDKSISLVTKDMLKIADEYYTSASQAYIKIPWRLRGAIIIASRLYRGIGQKLIDKQQANPMKGRVYLKKREKFLALGKGLGDWASSSFKNNRVVHQAPLHKALIRWKSMRGFPS